MPVDEPDRIAKVAEAIWRADLRNGRIRNRPEHYRRLAKAAIDAVVAEFGLSVNRREHHTCARGAEPQKRLVGRWEHDPERECPCAKWSECWHLDAYRCAREKLS